MHTTAARPPTVSVVVPAYNYGPYIGEMLESLQAQTYANWECFVVDDGSSDNTAEVVENFARGDARVKYVRQENQRQAAARNNGMRRCSGEYVQFLDADDLIEARKFERQVEYLERHPQVDIVYSGVRYFSADNKSERLHSRRYSVWDDGQPWMPEISGQGSALMSKLLRNNIMVVNSPLVRRRVIETVGEFNVNLTPVEDWDYWARCAARGMYFQYEDAEGVRALVRAHALSDSLDGRRMMRATLSMRREWAAKMLGDPGDIRANDELIAECEGLLGVEEALQGNRLKGSFQLLKAAVMDGRMRYRAKWFVCALLAPLMTREQLTGLVSTSLTQSAAGVLRRLQPNTRR
jgi:hypothetical protein